MKIEDRQIERNLIAQAIASYDSCSELLSEVSEQDFYHHAAEYKALEKMFNEGKPVDAVSYVQELRLNEIDTPLEYILTGDNVCGSFSYHLREIKKLTKARRLMRISHAIKSAMNSEETDVDAVFDYLTNEILEIEIGQRVDDMATPAEQAERMMDTLDEVLDDKRRTAKQVLTSCDALNYATGGFESGDLVIISGATGGGKSALAMNFVNDIAIKQKKPVLFINTEMSQKQIDLRWTAIITDDYGINNTNLRNGVLTDRQVSEAMAAIGKMRESEFYLKTIPDLTVAKMLSTVRRFVTKRKIKAVVIDYVGRIDTMNNSKDEWRQLKSAAQKLKTMAQKLGVVVFMVAQQNAEGQLAGSKQMEHEADLHLHIRPLTEKELESTDDYFDFALDVKKARSAKRGVTPCKFIGEKLKFVFDAASAKRYCEYVLDKKHQAAKTNSGTYHTPDRAAR